MKIREGKLTLLPPVGLPLPPGPWLVLILEYWKASVAISLMNFCEAKENNRFSLTSEQSKPDLFK